MTPEAMRDFAQASLDQGYMTMSTPACWKPPPGFPRGELLSQVWFGGVLMNNRSYDPAKVLRWLETSELLTRPSAAAAS